MFGDKILLLGRIVQYCCTKVSGVYIAVLKGICNSYRGGDLHEHKLVFCINSTPSLVRYSYTYVENTVLSYR